jgi:amino acid adenylation domain-containing protein
MDFSPISIAQQGIWYLCQSDDAASAAYNMVFAFAAAKPLDVDLLQRSLDKLCRRHELLRAAIQVHAGLPRLCTSPADVTVQVCMAAAGTSLQACVLEEGRLPFDFSVAPLVRATIVPQTPESPGGVVFTFAHIIFDGTSADLVFDELATISTALASGCEPVLPPVACRWSDLVAEERRHAASPEGQAALQLALKRLSGIPSRLALPHRSGEADPASVVVRAACHDFEIGQASVSALNEAANRLRVSPLAFCLAVFGLVLHRFSGQADFGVSLPVSNRASLEAAAAVGYLTNLGVVRFDIRRGATVQGFLEAVQDQLFDVMEGAALPFPLLSKGMKRVGENIQGPLLQVGFGYAGHAATQLRLGDQLLTPVDGVPVFAKNELKLDLQEHPSGLRGRLLYGQDGFEEALMARMGALYQDMLRTTVDAVLKQPGMNLAALPTLTAHDRARQLKDWNRASQTEDAARCVHELFDEQVRAVPEAVAVVCDGQQLSYCELDARANQVAHLLREWGVGPDVLVGLCVERGLDMVVGLLGIVKAGGAYVPLDPEYPAQRLAYMLQDTAAPVLLTQQHLLDSLPLHGAHTLLLDAHRARIAQQPTTTPANLSRSEHLVYCIYTSGSTGTPKGALNTHKGVANLVRWYFSPDMATVPNERVMLSSSLSFDLTQKNVLGPLLCGATLIVPTGRTADADAFHAALQRHRPTRINCAPSAYRLYRSSAPLGALRMAVLGGEPVDATLAAEFSGSPTTLVNSYGPTECADVAVAWVHPAEAPPAALPLGRPIPNVQVYVVDQDLALLPAGATGELCIAGVGVGRGYLNRPELTAERFVPDPFGPPGGRMYRTGDLARYREDGCLEFLGRVDHQVKIRGQRIELGEIEAALASHPDVREAAVSARSDEGAEPRLVGYLVGDSALGQTVESVRAHLLRQLPAYMVPTAWVVLDSLPLGPNGKLDRTALPAPNGENTHAARYVAPGTPAEELLARLWAKVLGVERVGIHDNFFALGGHSLLATQIANLLAEHGHSGVRLRRIFDHPTIAGLAADLDQTPPQETGSGLAGGGPITRLSRKRDQRPFTPSL